MNFFLSWLGGILGGPFVNAAVSAYKAKLDAGTSQATLEAQLAQKQLELQAKEDELSQQVVIAEEGRFWPFVRWGFAAPFIIYDWKIIVWDRVLQLGHTDQLLADQLQLQMIIVTAYFGHSAITNVTRALTSSKKV